MRVPEIQGSLTWLVMTWWCDSKNQVSKSFQHHCLILFQRLLIFLFLFISIFLPWGWGGGD